MKFILFAAAALIATPALAQTSGSTGTSSPSNVGASDQPNNMKNPAAQDASPADPATTTQQAPMQDSTASQPMSSMPPAPTTGGTMTPGGYQPSQPMPMASGGQQPVFTPGPSVEQAYPAPAPLASYPVCKKGQYDKCIQRGGK